LADFAQVRFDHLRDGPGEHLARLTAVSAEPAISLPSTTAVLARLEVIHTSTVRGNAVFFLEVSGLTGGACLGIVIGRFSALHERLDFGLG